MTNYDDIRALARVCAALCFAILVIAIGIAVAKSEEAYCPPQTYDQIAVRLEQTGELLRFYRAAQQEKGAFILTKPGRLDGEIAFVENFARCLRETAAIWRKQYEERKAR